jgi:trehalose synthase
MNYTSAEAPVPPAFLHRQGLPDNGWTIGHDHDPTVMQVSVGDSLGGCAAVVRAEMAHYKAAGWAPTWHHATPVGAAMVAAEILDPCVAGGTDTVFDLDNVRTGIEVYQNRFGEDLASGNPVDVMILHDPMCLTLAPYARRRARTVAWRCHLGHAAPTDAAAKAQLALAPYLDYVDVIIFADQSLVWPTLQSDTRVVTIPPGTDPASLKNRALASDVLAELWSSLVRGHPFPDVGLPIRPGAPGGDHLARCGPPRSGDLDPPFVLQVARWDPLKGNLGVLEGFAALARSHTDLELVLLGPRIDPQHSYSTDQAVWDQLVAAREKLEIPIRRRVHLWRFTIQERMVEDVLINVAQRKADTVVQNSRRETFGLTVAEAMCKGAVVVGSDADGIRLQISHDVNGLLTPYSDGGSLAWVETVHRARTDRAGRTRWCQNARNSVHERFTLAQAVRRQIGIFDAFSSKRPIDGVHK